MKIPGFTAEAALNKIDRQFQLNFTSTFAAEGGRVRAANSVYVEYPCWYSCRVCAQEYPLNLAACVRCDKCGGANVAAGSYLVNAW